AEGQSALTKGIVGTPQYMAPEQFRGLPEARSDVWGLGATLYELLTLRRAFDGESVGGIEHRGTTKEPQPLEKLVGNIPADLKAICHKAMKKNAEQRYETAHELADDLRRWLGNEPTRARPAWPVRKTWLWAKRNKGWAAAIAVGVLAFV